MPANFNANGTSVETVYCSYDYIGYSNLWTWGSNNNGQLGDATRSSASTSPIKPVAYGFWNSASGSGWETAYAIKTDGTLWSWGNNSVGGLGLGDVTNRSSPVQVGTLTNWSLVSSGYYHALAIKTDGTLWSWGNNTDGQLGLGNTTNRSSPVQVGALTNWSKIVGGYYHSLAIKTDGTLWSWGRNSDGQLGLGDITNRSSPVQVGTLTNWSLVSAGSYHSLAIKTDGTLWSWGYNSKGQLGLGNITGRSSPVQVGTLTNWSLVSSGYYHSLAIKTDGTLWSWGSNSKTFDVFDTDRAGQLGLGDVTPRSSPVQVGALTNWSKVFGGSCHSLAIKTDGTLWSWGYNIGDGQLGVGDTIKRSSPVQVGSLTNWSLVTCGRYYSMAVANPITVV